MPPPARLERIASAKRPIIELFQRFYTAGRTQADVCDFTFGNPHDMPLPELVDALQRWAVPQDKDWFAYKTSEPSARRVVAESLRTWRGLDFVPDDIALTNGGFGALAAAMFALLEPGDEVIYSLPPWFNYEPMVLAMGGEPVKVKVLPDDFDLDLAAIEAAVGPRTRIVIVNTYGKILLAPGQRLGWLAMAPTLSDRERLRSLIWYAQCALGWLFPNALMQHAIEDLDRLSIDLELLQRKRDWMVETLRGMGYQLHSPEATFYLLPRSPLADDRAFMEILAEEKVFVLPGQVCEMPGYFRISLTANEAMIERSLPRFARAISKACDN